MPQASLNVHNKEPKECRNDGGRSNGSYLAGIIFFLIVLGTIIWSGWMVLNWMKDVNRFPISKLVITGERHYTRDDNVRKAILALGMPGTFMTIDVNAIQNQIKTIPWIRQVTVRKQWPDELKIHLAEYKPYAKWNDTFFINAEGSVFSLPALLNFKGNFLMLYGPQGSQQEVLEMYHVMQQQLASYNFSIKSVSMTDRRAWQLVLANDIRLNIGKQDIKERLNRFVELYPLLKQVTDKRIGYIDLRYGSGAAVGWLPLLAEPVTH
ncbi:Cell division protein FtsQ [Arsenophonus endosymbiont of Aleurodicus floccissimus]|uniref:cell division protein FtsQ n=1 Tax=Arsenophonus endosymbiont of Aleurodicus floccissimus TaxID=2152761 RepID=UPI000E6B2839|nr:cell division protein FtsQ [Arsenophonus endosymbiont of Aleurodicus floccissimus]SPP32251.1 Cell division protein FtsQ [Arsenophonus endosymbiont of Aleurodicus floccissimus]